MEIPNSLIYNPPRESAGSLASKGFDYQKNWAICLILKLHEAHDDYVILFDFHEDVVAVTKHDGKHQLEFYQVKTKNKGNYIPNDFCQKKEKERQVIRQISHCKAC